MVRKFSPEQLKRIEEAMRMYAEGKCKEQRFICQFDFEQAYEEDEDIQRNDALINMYELNSLQNDSETPEMD
jgi:metal-dependent amidase/aminoacylase/carboxypeptidase family protein